MRSPPTWGIKQRRLVFDNDVSGKPFPPSGVRQYKNNTGNAYVRSLVGDAVGGNWFSENVAIVCKVTGTRRTRKGEGQTA